MVSQFSIILGLLPAIVWLIFFLQEDRSKPEPKGMIISTFIVGGLITLVVLQLQIYFQEFTNLWGLKEYNSLNVFFLAGIEEFLKFLAVYLWVSRRKSFDEPIDAMIYMVVAALGFATVENVVSVSRAVSGFELITLRFLGATLVHSLSSGLVGYYWARAILFGQKIWPIIILGLLLATIIHTIFNSLILIFGPNWQITTFLGFVAFFILADFEKLKINPK